MPYIDEITTKRKENFDYLKEKLGKSDKYLPLEADHIEFVSNFSYPLICKSQEIRDEIVANCEEIVEVRPIISGDITKQPFFKKHSSGDFHNSNAHLIHEQGFYFANNPDLTDEEIEKIIEALL